MHKCKSTKVQEGDCTKGRRSNRQKCKIAKVQFSTLLHLTSFALLPFCTSAPYTLGWKKRRLGNSKGAVFFIRRLSFPTSFSGVFLFRRLFLASLFFGVFYDRCAKVQTGIRVEVQNGRGVTLQKGKSAKVQKKGNRARVQK